MTWQEIIKVVAREAKRLEIQSDERISIGYFRKPDETKPLGMFNLPEFRAIVSISMEDVNSPKFAADEGKR